jgi:hypothetical protein
MTKLKRLVLAAEATRINLEQLARLGASSGPPDIEDE